jgi:hypothetical protein
VKVVEPAFSEGEPGLAVFVMLELNDGFASLITVKALAPHTFAFALALLLPAVAVLRKVVQLAVGAVTVSGTENVLVAVGLVIVPRGTEPPPLNTSVTVSAAKVYPALPEAEPSAVCAALESQVAVALLVPVAEGALLKVQLYAQVADPEAGTLWLVLGVTEQFALDKESATLAVIASQVLGLLTVMLPETFQPLSVTVTVYEMGTLLPEGASYSALSGVLVMLEL